VQQFIVRLFLQHLIYKICFVWQKKIFLYMKSSDAKASKCHLKFSCIYQTCIFKFSNFTSITINM